MGAALSNVGRGEEHSGLPASDEPFAGKYAVERIIGQGGMGLVFEARHVRLGQRVAIKVLGSELRAYPELVQRFEREARACGALSSRHAVRVFDIDATEDGTPFIVMELLAGRDLARIIERDGPQPVSRSVRWLIQACDAIAEAHRLGIVHRDIKPSNLFLTDVEGEQSVVKVLDFGIAKRVAAQEVAITQAVAPLGTPQYMSPEQVRCAKDVDARSDVWSLGVTLYELVTGQTPFAHESSSACIAAIAADPVPDPRALRPDLPRAFVDVLMRALEKNVNARYQSVEELVAAIAPFGWDEDLEDETMVSAVRRAFLLPSVVKADEHPTLDAEDAYALSPSPSPVSVDVAAPARRGSIPSMPDRTVPPAVSRASVPTKRRVRSSLVMASAAALGLAALVLTPRCVATQDEGARNALHATTTVRSAVTAAAPVLDVPAAAADEATPPAAAPAAAAMPVVVPGVVAPVVVVEPVLTPEAAASAPARRPVVVRAKADRATPLPAPARSGGVHGGLSNPGF